MTNPNACLSALADPTRRRIFEKVSRRPRAVRDLAQVLPVSRPAVSQHLKVLAAAGLVRAQVVGTRRIYRLEPRGLAVLRTYFDQFWNQALTNLKAAAEHKGDSA